VQYIIIIFLQIVLTVCQWKKIWKLFNNWQRYGQN